MKKIILSLTFLFPFLLTGQSEFSCKNYVVVGVVQQNTDFDKPFLDEVKDEFRHHFNYLTKCGIYGLDFLNETSMVNEILSLQNFNFDENDNLTISETTKSRLIKEGKQELIFLRIRNTNTGNQPFSFWAYFVDIKTTKINKF